MFLGETWHILPVSVVAGLVFGGSVSGRGSELCGGGGGGGGDGDGGGSWFACAGVDVGSSGLATVEGFFNHAVMEDCSIFSSGHGYCNRVGA